MSHPRFVVCKSDGDIYSSAKTYECAEKLARQCTAEDAPAAIYELKETYETITTKRLNIVKAGDR